LKFRQHLWSQKTKFPGLPYVHVWRCLRGPMFSRFGTILACDGQTDGQMDGHTHDDSTYRASIVSGAVKIHVQLMFNPAIRQTNN